jgi:hypothetical protein
VIQHTLLWVLRNHRNDTTTDCEVWKESGAAHVRLRRDGESDVVSDFTDASKAVRWAFDFERLLMSEGWEKVV